MTHTASPRSSRRVIVPHPARHALRLSRTSTLRGERSNLVWRGLVWAFVIEFAVVALVVTIVDDWWIALALLIVGVLEWSNIVYVITR